MEESSRGSRGEERRGEQNGRDMKLSSDISHIRADVPVDEAIKPYKIHISTKYLNLTKQKLQLTRLPHEISTRNASFNASKSEIEPLIDFWLEEYSWRKREDHFNATLPQFKTQLALPEPSRDGLQKKSVRVHFLHFVSKRETAVPLLLLPPFPLSNLSVPIEALINPLIDPEDEKEGAFHVIVPSFPGLGFSDSFERSSENGDGEYLQVLAGLMDGLMKRLGYEHYLCSSAGSGLRSLGGLDYYIARTLAEAFGNSCLGTHLIEPMLKQPRFGHGHWKLWARWRAAGLVKKSWWGYEKDDWDAMSRSAQSSGRISGKNRQESKNKTSATHNSSLSQAQSEPLASALQHPNTFSYAYTDSPVGLLSIFVAGLRATNSDHSLSKEQIIELTQLMWLPGPEGALRLASNACVTDAKHIPRRKKWQTSRKPKVAITVFAGDGKRRGSAYHPPAWAKEDFDVVITQRCSGTAGILMLERPEVVVEGIRRLARSALSSSRNRKKLLVKGMAVPEVVVQNPTIVVNDEDGQADDAEEAESPNTVILIDPLELAAEQRS